MSRAKSARGSDEKGGRRNALVLAGMALPFLIGLYVVVLAYWAHPASGGSQLRLDQFVELVAKGRVSSATILAGDDRIVGVYDGGRYWVDFAGGHESLFARLTGALEEGHVPTTVRRQPLKTLVGPVTTVLPALIAVDGFFILFLLARGGAPLGGFAKSGARQGPPGGAGTTFADLAGIDGAVVELAEVVDYLADPARYAAIGAAVPKGVLLSGPPGCGKTRLARAVAGESGGAFFSLSGSDFVEMYVGVGAARIRDLFAQAKAAAPAIVFIDELDAVGRARVAASGGGGDEREATLNQLLVEMDGFEAATGVVVIAATNRPDVLDAALLRPGRFDRRITIDPPDLKGRQAVLALHARGKPLADDVDLEWVARCSAGFSGAELANVINEAALLATRRGAATVGAAELAEAVERVVAGPQCRSRVLSAADRRRIACHEAGHALSATALPGADPVAKISILARGHGGGFTWFLPQGDQVLATRSQLCDRLVALLGGQAAEQLMLGESSTGSADDLARATELARRMVVDFGMSDRLGPMTLSAGPDGAMSLSGSTTQIDAEVRTLLNRAMARANTILSAHSDALVRLAEELTARETLEGDVLQALLTGISSDGESPGRMPPPELVAAFATNWS